MRDMPEAGVTTIAMEMAAVHDPDLNTSTSKKSGQPRSLFVRSLPASATSESLAEHFSQSYPLKHATVVVDSSTKQSKGYGFVTFADAADAQKAKDEFDSSVFDGKKIRVDVAQPRRREVVEDGITGRKSQPSADFVKAREDRQKHRLEGQKPSKLIIRNLPWSIKEPEHLALLFRSYGKVKHATLPKTKPGLSPGFGFVVLRGRRNAEKALAGVNGKVVDGRTLAVDWAIEKDVWQTLQKVDEEKVEPTSSEAAPLEHRDDDEVSFKSEDGGAVTLSGIPPSDTEHDEISDADDLETLSDTEDVEGDEAEPDYTAGDDSCTLFLRNLAFTTTDDALFDHFKVFGPVRYARVVMDHATDRSRGTGFVCFYKAEDAQACVREAPKSGGISYANGSKEKSLPKHSLLEDIQSDPSGRYTVEGRVINVTRAVHRDEAHRLTADGTSLRDARDKDKRRLYLLSEGTIPSDSPAYASLAPSEAKMREDSSKQRQALIRSNPSLHLSLTRLSVRNLPRHVTSKDLKALAREAVVGFAKDVKDGKRRQLSKEELSRGGIEMREAERERKAKGKGIVKQATIVFEGREGSKVAEISGAGRSRGYGFIEYSSHRWALMGLRWLNGHAVKRQTDSNTDSAKASAEKSKRLIVEFSIENALVVARRRDREHKARERSMAVGSARARGEARNTEKRVVSKDSMMAQSRRAKKRKLGATATDPDDQQASVVEMESEKVAKRQRIIGKKRAIRKAKKSGS